MCYTFEEYLKLTKSKKEVRFSLKYQCPHMVFERGNMCNQETVMFSWRPFSKVGNIIGCDNIRCKDCWKSVYNYEIIEEV